MRKNKYFKATRPPKMKDSGFWFLPLFLGIYNAAMALGQLAKFEEFVEIFGKYALVPEEQAVWLALFIIALEILSLPVLLRFRTSLFMRALSASAAVLIAVLWAQIVLYNVFFGAPLENTGIFGSLVPYPSGWWLALDMLAYLALTIYALHMLGGEKLLKLNSSKN
jgi:hypothetical protein